LYLPRGKYVAAAYIEIFRGTPVLLQLFVLYYGLARVLSLDAYSAAVLGLGMNYAAYEAEIYRAGLEAVPRGQLEAALSLGVFGGARPPRHRGAPGAPHSPSADDQRLHCPPQGQLARVGDHGSRADQAHGHHRRGHAQLAHSGRAVRWPLLRDELSALPSR